MRSLIVLMAISLTIFSCQSSDDTFVLEEDDYLIFGHFYGMCIGDNCVQTFKLTRDKLYQDTKKQYFGTEFEFEQLDHKLFERVRDLEHAFPEQLLTEKNEVIGCPDCADGGGLFIQLSKNGWLHTWRIDQYKANVPEYLHDFVDQVNEKIALVIN